MDSYQRSDPGPISAGPVIERFEDRLELIATGQAVAVLSVGDWENGVISSSPTTGPHRRDDSARMGSHV
jgi:hypothetical protein